MLVVGWDRVECRFSVEVQTECTTFIAQIKLLSVLSVQYASVVVICQEETNLCVVVQCLEGSNAVDGNALRLGLRHYLALHFSHIGNGLDGSGAVNGYTGCQQGFRTVCA